MKRKFSILKTEYPYHSKIIKKLICRKSDIEWDVVQINKKIFGYMLLFYIEKEELNRKRDQEAVKSKGNANAKTAKLWLQYQKLHSSFMNKYGDFYSAFVKFSSVGPGPRTERVTFDYYIANSTKDSQLLNQFEIAVRKYECGQSFPRAVHEADNRQEYDKLGKLAFLHSQEWNDMFAKDRPKGKKWAIITKWIKKKHSKLIRFNAVGESEQERVRQAAVKYKKQLVE